MFSGCGKNMKIKSGIKPMTEIIRLKREFFTRDVLEVAPDLLAKVLAVKSEDDEIRRYVISETEAYRGAEDKACHASKGRTPRTEVMYHKGGRLYVYFVYGVHWMLNVVTAEEDNPQAVLIRGLENFPGPGRVTKILGIDRSFYGEDLVTSGRIWIEDLGVKPEFKTGTRIGIEYAGETWKSKPWRFYLVFETPSGAF
jgi:DNA-3-methyladenine glycosylase